MDAGVTGLDSGHASGGRRRGAGPADSRSHGHRARADPPAGSRRHGSGFTTRMLRTLAAVALVCLTAATTALAARSGSTAQAASAVPAAEPFPTIPLSGRTQRGSFTGRLAVTRVFARGDQVIASGRVSGRLRDRRYPSVQAVTIRRFSVVLGVTATAGAADCASLTMTIPARQTRLVGLRAELPAATFVVRPQRNGPRAVPDLLCATSQLLAAQPPAIGVAPSPVVLNLLNALRLVHA